MTADTHRPHDTGAPFTTGVATIVYFALAFVFFLPAFLPFRHIYGSDYFAAGFFTHEFVSTRLAEGDLPGWLPFLYGGVPLFANPGSSFYPVRWLADFLLPTSRIFPVVFVVQFALAGLGTYLLTRELGARRWIAFVAGIAFQFTGLTMSYVLAGHDGRIIVATLAPLLFYFLHNGVRTGSIAHFVGAAATVGFALLSFQIQSAYYLLLAGAIWAVFCIVHHGVHRTPKVLVRRVLLGLGAVAFGFALAAVNFLPFLDYVEQSPRGEAEGRGYEYATSWSMQPRELIGLAVPEQAGVLEHYRGANPFKLHTEYAGALVVALLVLGFAYARRDRRWWFFLGLSVFALTISFGGHTAIYRLWYELLPGTKRFRSPSISFFLVSMSIVIMAALAFEAIASRLDQPTRKGRAEPPASLPHFGKWLLGIGALALLGLLVAMGADDGTARAAARSAGWLRFAAFLGAALGLLWAWSRHAISPRTLALSLAVLTVVDLWVIDRRFFETREGPEDTFAPDDVVSFLTSRPEPARVWALPLGGGVGYPREPNYLMRFGIAQAGGEHGNQLQRYNEFVGAGEQTYVDWHNFLAGLVDPTRTHMLRFLDAANVRYLVAGAPLQGLPYPIVHSGPGGVVFENPNALPRAWLVGSAIAVPAGSEIATMSDPSFDFRATAIVDSMPGGALPGDPVSGSARIASYEPDRVVIETQADRDALLVLADTYYPDWSATVDGNDAHIARTNHAFRGVRVPAGTHTVVFEFAPAALRTGFIVWLVGLASLAAFGLFLIARAWRSRHQPAAITVE